LATYQAIAATGQGIIKLLADACPDEFEGAGFELYQMKDFGSPMDEGVSLYLYRVAVNGSRRNLPPTLGPDGKRYRPPVPLDLFFLLTAWSKTAARQNRLLGWAVRTLQDFPVLHASLLNYYSPELEVFRPGETVELILDNLTLQDMSNMWFSSSKSAPQLSVGYIVRMVAIESSVEMSEHQPVQTREFDYGKVTAA
jgi:hypothetical protein